MSWWGSSAPCKEQLLMITAAASYDDRNAQIVPVNLETPITIVSPIAEIQLVVRIRGFAGASGHSKDSSIDSRYFQERKDANISLQLSMTPVRDISADSLLFGNDFPGPIRDYLPYGTGVGLKVFQSYVDPSVDGDLYADVPYLYGRALSSFNVVRNNVENLKEDEGGPLAIEENLANTGETELSIPTVNTARQRFFQNVDNLEKFVFLKGRTYQFDFFSGFLSLKDSKIQISLPGGFDLDLSKYVNDKFNCVRYVLKVAESKADIGVEFGEPLLVITFELQNAPDDANASSAEEILDVD